LNKFIVSTMEMGSIKQFNNKNTAAKSIQSFNGQRK